jgi:competence protein ComEC
MNTLLKIAISGIDHTFHEPYASLMKGLVYGLPIQIDPALKQNIVKSGLAHLIVLSGTNVTLLAQFSERIFFAIGKRVGVLLQLLLLTLFIYMVGPQAPLIRAACMFFCTVVCILAGRPSYIGWNLFLTILFIAWIQPKWATSLSFQLSVFATVGIIIWGLIAARIKRRIHPLLEVFFESWIVFLVTTPLVMMSFKSVSLMSPISTALVSWLIVPLMVAGFSISLLYRLFPFLAFCLAVPTQMGLQYIVSVVQIISNLPFGYYIFK